MAIFEKRFEGKFKLDDTETLTCVIETAQNLNGHTEYVLRLQRGPLKNNTWQLLRRYNDFVALDKCLRISGIAPPLPAKKIIGNMRPDFIAARRLALQEYINSILMNPILASSLPTKKFVDPESYNQSFHDIAVQNASLCLRSDGQYSIGQSMGAIGWRLRKHYFKVTPKGPHHHKPNSAVHQSSKQSLIKSASQSKSGPTNGSVSTSDSTGQNQPEFILTWTEYGPDKYIDEKEIHSIMKSLAAIQHPYIQPIDYVATNDSGILVIRKFHSKGSLKDILCGSLPKNPFLSKYGNPKGRTGLPMKDIAFYGRQILEAIRFLHSKGMPFGHVHAGNVIIVDDVARLLDIENFVLGVPSFYRPFYVQHSKLNSCEIIDVYNFGHLLYEMATGFSLQESYVRHIDCGSESLKSLLESILLKEACKVGIPTLDQLSQHPFFTENNTKFNESYMTAINANKPHLKFSTVAKEQLKIAAQRTELRLREEQKSVKNQKRLVRVQELMSSEEEKKKCRHKARMEQKQTKLRQQNSLQLHPNGPSASSTVLNRSDSIHSVAISQESILSPPPTGTSSICSGSSSSTPQPPPPPPPQLRIVGGTQPMLAKCESRSLQDDTLERSALLDSICHFNKAALRKVASTD